MPKTFQMYIDGEWCGSDDGKMISVQNPATGELVGAVPSATREQAARAVISAAGVKVFYRHTEAAVRYRLLYSIAEEIDKNRTEMAETLSMEQGKPLYKEAFPEVDGIAHEFRQAAEDLLRMKAELLPSACGMGAALIKRQADGLYAVITPWNYPLEMPVQYIAPGLAGGNVIVFKPASNTPLSAALLAQAVAKGLEKAGLPPQIFQFVTGSGGVVGDALVSHRLVDAIGFTGETVTGKNILARAGLKKVILEMGGNGPTLVLEDCNIPEAAKQAAVGFLDNAGQICSGTERIFVQKSIKEPFLKALAEEFQKIKLGNPLLKETEMGPLNNEAGAEKLELHIADALKKGAKLICGGKRAPQYGSDLFFEPTILDEVTEDMMIYTEETFGPVAPVIAFDSLEEAVGAANNGIYGLQMAVFTSSMEKARYAAEHLRAGVVSVNTSSAYYESHYPFGGAVGTETGWGRVGGKYALEQMTHTKTIIIQDRF